MRETVSVACPYCGEILEIFIEVDLGGKVIEECSVCCRPMQLTVSHDENYEPLVRVERSQ